VVNVGGAKKESGHLEKLKLLPYNDKLDLTYFYTKAKEKGYYNNCSKEVLIDCFNDVKEKQFWILYEEDLPIGSVGVHSFDDVMGPGSYRILARTCIVKPVEHNLRNKSGFKTHDHVVDKLFVPQCLLWANSDKVYATSNMSSIASQRLVHTIYFPIMQQMGLVSKIKEVEYRKQTQTVWQYHPEKFLTSLYSAHPSL